MFCCIMNLNLLKNKCMQKIKQASAIFLNVEKCPIKMAGFRIRIRMFLPCADPDPHKFADPDPHKFADPDPGKKVRK